MKTLDMSPYCENPQEGSIYNLIANIRHNGTTKDFWYNLHLLQKSTDKWYDIQDLIVEEAMPPLIALSEAYIQFYERVDTPQYIKEEVKTRMTSPTISPGTSEPQF